MKFNLQEYGVLLGFFVMGMAYWEWQSFPIMMLAFITEWLACAILDQLCGFRSDVGKIRDIIESQERTKRA